MNKVKLITILIAISFLVGFGYSIGNERIVEKQIEVPVEKVVEKEVPTDPAIYAERDVLKAKIRGYEDLMLSYEELITEMADGFTLASEGIEAVVRHDTATVKSIENKINRLAIRIASKRAEIDGKIEVLNSN
jgi:hypothetical protein